MISLCFFLPDISRVPLSGRWESALIWSISCHPPCTRTTVYCTTVYGSTYSYTHSHKNVRNLNQNWPSQKNFAQIFLPIFQLLWLLGTSPRLKLIKPRHYWLLKFELMGCAFYFLLICLVGSFYRDKAYKGIIDGKQLVTRRPQQEKIGRISG